MSSTSGRALAVGQPRDGIAVAARKPGLDPDLGLGVSDPRSEHAHRLSDGGLGQLCGLTLLAELRPAGESSMLRAGVHRTTMSHMRGNTVKTLFYSD